MSGIFNASIFNNAIFNTGLAGDVAVKTGTGGIDPKTGKRRIPFKPTGLIERQRKEGRKTVDDRADESAQIAAEVAAKVAREFSEESRQIEARTAEPPIVQMSMAEIDFEIGILLRKKLRTEEDELMLVLMLAAAA